MPRTVSIVVNNYNYGRYLAAAVESALAQTHPHTEVVVVDDGSTDGSRDLIRSYGDRITPVLKENGGQASAFNAGFAASRGDVVLFLDADDLLLPTAAAEAAAALAGPGIAKVQWPLRVIDAEGRSTGALYPGRPLEGGDLRKHVLLNGPNCYVNAPTSGNAWPRWFLERALPARDSGDGHGGDAYLSCLAPVDGLVRTLTEPQSLYRVHAENFSGRTLGDRIERDLRRHDFLCGVLAERLREQGADFDPEAWKRPGTYYAWMAGLRDLHAAVEDLMEPAEAFILVDEDQWGTGETVAGRRRFHFLEREGRYWGPPADDRAALDELEHLRARGAAWMAFAGHAFWWLEHYPGLKAHLDAGIAPAHSTGRLKVFRVPAP